MIQLPKITSLLAGLTFFRGKFHVIKYVDGKTRRYSLETKDEGVACFLRDVFHLSEIAKGATYRGLVPANVLEAIKKPKCMACVHKVVTYRVVVGSKTVGSSSDKEVAKKIRDKYIKQNYKLK